jgi:hypothetical protein
MLLLADAILPEPLAIATEKQQQGCDCENTTADARLQTEH